MGIRNCAKFNKKNYMFVLYVIEGWWTLCFCHVANPPWSKWTADCLAVVRCLCTSAGFFIHYGNKELFCKNLVLASFEFSKSWNQTITNDVLYFMMIYEALGIWNLTRDRLSKEGKFVYGWKESKFLFVSILKSKGRKLWINAINYKWNWPKGRTFRAKFSVLCRRR